MLSLPSQLLHSVITNLTVSASLSLSDRISAIKVEAMSNTTFR